MCGPAVIPIAAAAASVVSAAGSIYGGLAANAQGKYESAVANQNARLANDQAADAIDRGRLQQRQLYRKVGDLKGQQAAAMAANGIDLGFGSALDVQRDTAMMGAEDAESLNSNIAAAVKGYEINAANYRSEGQAARMKGRNALVGSAFQAAGTLLSGASQFGQLRAKYG